MYIHVKVFITKICEWAISYMIIYLILSITHLMSNVFHL